MPATNPSLAGRAANPMFALAELAYGRGDLIHLEFGEPGFPTPAHIAAAAHASIARERQGYGPASGPSWLRAELAARIQRVNRFSVAPEQVIVTPGGTGALTVALLVLCAAGDEVLVPDPGWPGYEGILATASAVPRTYPLLPEAGWQPDLAALERLVTPRTRVLLLNSPSNPGGAVLARSTVEALVELARRHDLWIVSDECYDELLFAGEHVSPAALDASAGSGRVLTVGTCSKSYAMTGWRVGWVSAPRALAASLGIAVAAQVNNLPLFALRAAEAALTAPQDCVGEMRAAYQARRDLALEVLRAHGLADYTPAGAFYLLVDVARATGRDPAAFDSIAFARALLAERGVVAAPGAAFGATIPSRMRVSLAGPPDELREGLECMVAFAGAWGA